MTTGEFMGQFGLLIFVYLGLVALGIWIQYLIIRTAVDHGMRRFTQWQRDKAVGGVKLK